MGASIGGVVVLLGVILAVAVIIKKGRVSSYMGKLIFTTNALSTVGIQ